MDKIQGKFYRLQHFEWLRACHELQPSERDVLYYIRTLDPYEKGIELSISNIASDLSTPKKKVHKSTVSRALKALNERGFIDLELIQVRVKITVAPMQSVLPAYNAVVSTQRDVPSDNAECHQATYDATTQQSVPETASRREVETPKINKTYKEFKDSLSDSERESFFKFGENKAKQLPKPPQLISKWIGANWEEIRDEWLKANNKPSMKLSSKWANHPLRAEWLEVINTEGYGVFVYLDGDYDPERKEFLDWAFKEDLVRFD